MIIETVIISHTFVLEVSDPHTLPPAKSTLVTEMIVITAMLVKITYLNLFWSAFTFRKTHMTRRTAISAITVIDDIPQKLCKTTTILQNTTGYGRVKSAVSNRFAGAVIKQDIKSTMAK